MDRDQERAIEWDVFQIHNRYYVLGDAGDHEAASTLFTKDGVSVYEGQALNGRAEILNSLQTSHGPRFTYSFVANCTVTVIDEQNAEAASYVQQYFHERDEIKDGTISALQPYTLVRHDNRFVLTDEGWKIKHRNVTELIRRD